MSERRKWLVDGLVGVVVGGVVGAIVAVNLLTTVGIGYDVTPAQVVREHLFVGSVTLGILISGPIVGVVVMRRLRRKRPAGRPS